MPKSDRNIKDLKNKILEQILSKLERKIPENLKKTAHSFVELFYANVPWEDLSELSSTSLVNSIYESWKFDQVRLPGETKIRVFTDKRDVRGHPVFHTIVEVINDNMPFLVDSVAGAINSLGYSISLIVHPVMHVERDKNHNLKVIKKRIDGDKDGQYESFIRCEIPELIHGERLKTLEFEITKALNNVKAAVQDWAPMRKRLREAIIDLKENSPKIAKEELDENIAFLEWIEDHHFTFLGFCQFDADSEKYEMNLTTQEGLGILKGSLKEKINNLFEGVKLTPTNRQYLFEPDPIIITKTTQLSLVHRRDPMDSISIKRFDSKGNVIGLYEFVGLFTSVVYNRSIRTIPLLRLRVAHILSRSGFSEDWHDGKTLIHLLETFPRDELFQASENWLFETLMAIIQLQNRQRLTLFIRPDNFERFFSCIVYIPRERYDSDLRKKISVVLEEELNGQVTSWQIQLGELAFARVHFTVKLLEPKKFNYNLHAIEQKMADAALTWRDHLQESLLEMYGEEKGHFFYDKYGTGFSEGYQERFSPSEAITDIGQIEKAIATCELRSHLSKFGEKEENKLQLKLYSSQGPLTLSTILPVLENMNFKILSEIPFIISLSKDLKIWIHIFEVQTWEEDFIELDRIQDHFLQGFKRIWSGEVENDGFNRLIIRANFDWRECQLFRSYSKYIRQLRVTFSQTYMEEVLAKYPHLCHLMLQLFECQFSPECKEDRERARVEVSNRITAQLEHVESLDEDRIIRKFVNVISATLRTNYYQVKDDQPKSYVSLKIDCTAIDEMPLPRPMYEIFVYSPRVEAIHLRGGKVARGGIRWSDRREDFRTEILGLMKAQMVKNAVIVPVGSKGGFVLKQAIPRDDREALSKEVTACYEIMMRGLLDLTDNIQNDEVIPPERVVRRDDDDPYLVVAADKGTATLSDYANKISADYNFWLGDAFASGGSSGYDHKKMGITAKGAWESVRRHFKEMNINADHDTLSVVGIGDMSGDVFGNGMLLSRHLKLVAAFNHLHIFIDPNPNPEKSYQERERLFKNSQSSWTDYKPLLISQGGGVFERRAKSITITPEMKALFNIREDKLVPSELVRYILKAPVDLIWFGGIGTFIKSTGETNAEVGDHANDAVRINGGEVRAKVIAEGANLGITQLGRVEYAKIGGRINTDAIDNSAGVDCSDHEVNIKVLLGKTIKEKELSIKNRDRLLQEMTDDVARHVLKDNFWQNQVISFVQSQGFSHLDEQVGLMRELESEGLLNRALEGLPDETEISQRIANKQGLMRPELAVLLAYSKISLKRQILQSELPDLEVLHSRLLGYFPERLQHACRSEIIDHPLKREITATLFTNSIINRMGITFIHTMKNRSEASGADVARTFLVVRDLMNLISLWCSIESLEMLPNDFQIELMLTISESVKRFTDWFLRLFPSYRDIPGTIENFKPGFEILQNELTSYFTVEQRKAYEEKCQEYEQLGLPPALSERVISLAPLVSAPDMIMLSKEQNVEISLVAKIYFALDQQLGFEWLRQASQALSGETHWQQTAANALIEELYLHQKELTALVLRTGETYDQLFTAEGTLRPDVLDVSHLETMLQDIKSATAVDFAMMTVMNSRFRMLAKAA